MEGVRGEIVIGGAGLARGYVGRADQTAERFRPDPYGERGGERVYRSGDIGRQVGGGVIEYIGRTDHQVKLRGYRIELGEIEEVMRGEEGVREAVVEVIERGGEGKDQRLIGYIEVEERVREEEVREAIRRKLPEYMVPGVIVKVERMPRGPSGKIDRNSLPSPDSVNLRRDREFVPPGTPLEETVAGVWAEVLGIEKVSIHDNFFELGGHSLLALQIAARLLKVFDVDLPIRKMFLNPTIHELSLAIEEALLDEISELSDEEAEQILANESN